MEKKIVASPKIDDAIDNSRLDIINNDGWTNLITGIGTTQNKSTHTTFTGYSILTYKMLSEIWVGDGFGAKIVSAAADDMTREWLTIDNDVDNLITNELDRLGAEFNTNLALKWQRLYGGSLVLMGINDGGELIDPVNITRIKSIDYLRVYDKSETTIYDAFINDDPTSVYFGEVEFIQVIPKHGKTFNVHVSRCMIFKGIPVPNRLDAGNFYYWGMSVLQPIWNNLRDMGVAIDSVGTILQEFLIGKYKIKGLAQKLAQGKEEDVKTRMNMIDLAKSVIQSVLLDADLEDYTRDSANVGGLPEILDRFMMFISGVADYPVTRLFGRSPSGENATGEGDKMNYYDMIKSQQKVKIKPQLTKLVNYINAMFKFKVDNPTIEFTPLFQLTESEEIANRKTQADTDKIYIDTGVLTSEEVTKSRFENGYSYETKVEFGV